MRGLRLTTRSSTRGDIATGEIFNDFDMHRHEHVADLHVLMWCCGLLSAALRVRVPTRPGAGDFAAERPAKQQRVSKCVELCLSGGQHTRGVCHRCCLFTYSVHTPRPLVQLFLVNCGAARAGVILVGVCFWILQHRICTSNLCICASASSTTPCRAAPLQGRRITPSFHVPVTPSTAPQGHQHTALTVPRH